MRKIILTYGLIGGVILSAILYITMAVCYTGEKMDFDNGQWIGYTSMVIALSLIFFAIRNYRDNQAGGLISFWKGFKIGLLITLIAGVLYGITWEICYHTIASDFTTKMTEHYVETLEAKGLPEPEMQKEKQQMVTLMEWYKNPVIRFMFTLLEILPVGILITLFSALVLRRRQIPSLS